MFTLNIATGLFNTFVFWHLGNSKVNMQSRLFSTLMALTICPPLTQQLQPRRLGMRSIYQSREGNWNIYSWVAFVCGAILSKYRIGSLRGRYIVSTSTTLFCRKVFC
ncbi:hypothetical protein K432DRAFT_5607 [Lepidopterella palustris CBS 459.81]|uniref:Uncharacterized protein n=1 Tax=Lepidopterella palustris CBS 459.81 TaxID=1314670 RepID=A0A8E2DX18_9PEZI|nr:hypothetical protein K432DRAFT_5607 [Lepidopterella palustris CBS 459.81]